MGNGNSQGLPMGMFANQYRISNPSEPDARSQVHGLPVSGLRIDAQKMPADVQPILDRFKKVFGSDMTQMKNQQFRFLVRIIQKYQPVYENTEVIPTPDAFNMQVQALFPELQGNDTANLIANSGLAYKYFYNDEKVGQKSSKTESITSITSAVGSGGQSFSDWFASLINGTYGSSATSAGATSGATGSTASPAATSALDYMTSVAPVGTPLPTVTNPGGAPTPGSASVTPANPVPDMSSFQTNASNILQSTALAANGYPAPAPIAPPATPPVST